MAENFLALLEKEKPQIQALLPEQVRRHILLKDECWEWQSARSRDGYGVLMRQRKNHRAHRFIYELVNGPIDASLVLDHTCRNIICVNPRHLEIVTNRQNILRGNGLAARNSSATHCIRGHEFNAINTHYKRVRGGSGIKRACRLCARIRYAEAT